MSALKAEEKRRKGINPGKSPPKKVVASPPPKKAWGEGPGLSEKNPVALKEQQNKRRKEAEKRRQEARS